MNPNSQIVADTEELSQRTAEEFALRSQDAVRGEGLFTVALSGGSTPRNLYGLLADGEASFHRKEFS
jgi:6-phosphogluconolactonase